MTLHPRWVPEGCFAFGPTPEARLRAWREEVRERMRQHYRADRAWWDELLARPSVTLLCRSCPRPVHCVRQVLAEDLGQLGAEVEGEGT